MFNNTKTDIIDRNTYVDEFEREAPSNVAFAPERTQSQEEIAFNSRISDNFDRILHYDTYNQQNEVKRRNETYQMYSSNVNLDVNPSSTTMQFRGMPKAEIYQDYKVESNYEAKTIVRPRAKLLMFALSVVICLLSTLVIFNTALLKDLNGLIEQKTARIEELTEEKLALEDVLINVSNKN
ncbi:MAG: hypothetical protein J6Q38_03880 [Clostridia bacterium]|nr:hypothetical protein [Clostridia bacterium]